jgi:hypothetical protein
MVPGDIPIVERIGMHLTVEGVEIPPSHTTFQHLEPPDNPYLPPQLDIIPDWSIEDTNAPLRLLLDYVYGVAVIRRWASKEVQNLFSARHEDDYKEQLRKKKSSRSLHTDSDDAKPDSNRPTTSHYNLRKRRGHMHMSKPQDSDMSRAMDDAFQFVLLFSGPGPYQPGTTFESMQKQREEEARMHSEQIAREKVENWLGLGTSESFPVLMVMD